MHSLEDYTLRTEYSSKTTTLLPHLSDQTVLWIEVAVDDVHWVKVALEMGPIGWLESFNYKITCPFSFLYLGTIKLKISLLQKILAS